MVDQGYAASTSLAYCKPGGFIYMTGYSHVMFIVYNDGTTIKYNAHTNDRKGSSTTTATGKIFYHIENIYVQ